MGVWFLPPELFKLPEMGRVPASPATFEDWPGPWNHGVPLSSSARARPPAPPCALPSWICTRTAWPVATSWSSTAAGCPRGSPTPRWMQGCSRTSWSSCSSAPKWCSSRQARARTWRFVTGKRKWVPLLLPSDHEMRVWSLSRTPPGEGSGSPLQYSGLAGCSPWDRQLSD